MDTVGSELSVLSAPCLDRRIPDKQSLIREAKRSAPVRIRLHNSDRLIFVWLYRLFPRLRQLSRENPLWAAPRIHGELLKLGIEVAQSTVAKYMIRHRGPPSGGWPTAYYNAARTHLALDKYAPLNRSTQSCQLG
jgi:hypothetical protein